MVLEDPDIVLSDEEVKKLWRKVDLKVLPMLSLLYLIQYMDRGNIGNAKIQGLATQLKLDANKYAISLTIFFLFYAICEVPSNLLLRFFPPRKYLPTLVIIWGVIMTASGFCRNYKEFYACRALLGVFEAGFFPGVTYYLTLWYPRNKFGVRLGSFFVCASLAGSFSGLLAFALAHLSGKGGYLGWTYIFAVEGAITVVFGFLGYLWVYNTPADVKWLTDKEKAYIEQQLNRDRGILSGGEDERITPRIVWDAITEWHTPFLAVLALLSTLPVNALNQFLPSIINSMGFTALNAQLLTIPVFASAIPVILIVAHFSDTRALRIPWLMAGFCLALVGWVLLATMSVHQKGPRLLGCFFVGIGIYGGFAAATSLTAAQYAGKSKRAVGIACSNTLSGLSGIIASNAFRTNQAPYFKPGCYTAIGASVLALIILSFLFVTYRTINRKRDEFMATTDKVFTPEEIARLGNNSPTYRYS
ncbi:MFS general substrate transporter [Meredithblackwellia eburnea MCA 4105]